MRTWKSFGNGGNMVTWIVNKLMEWEAFIDSVWYVVQRWIFVQAFFWGLWGVPFSIPTSSTLPQSFTMVIRPFSTHLIKPNFQATLGVGTWLWARSWKKENKINISFKTTPPLSCKVCLCFSLPYQRMLLDFICIIPRWFQSYSNMGDNLLMKRSAGSSHPIPLDWMECWN